ncbi:MAG TPA: uracil-DNA glycosylase [Kiritimatiellia bacterium]|nr:uracil-DNA glycosylase [Kiritimatiellia bacterium]
MIPAHEKQTINRMIHFLELLQDCGEKDVEIDRDTIRSLGPVLHTPRKPRKTAAARAVAEGLNEIAERVAACTQCELCRTRTNTVPGQGNPQPELMFVGEGPGADEDEQGLAFVGRAGQLLTDIIHAMQFTRENVFIGNIVKCRPPGNRVPEADEMEKCLPYLKEQIALLKPKVIVCLGATAVKGLFGPEPEGITKTRGTWRTYEGIDVMLTFHPAYLLRNPPAKREVWEDMKEVLRRLGRPIPVYGKKA